jgi:membrane protein
MRKKIKNWASIAKETIVAFRKHDGFTLAAALSFYAILSLIPLSMIVVSFMGHLLGNSEEAVERIIQLMTEAIPHLTPTFIKDLTAIIHRKMTSGWIGGVSLVIVASILFTNLEKILDKVFGAIRSRNFFHSRLLSIALIFTTSLFLFVPAVFRAVDLSLKRFRIPMMLTSLTTGDLFFLLVGWLIFILMIEVVPNHHVRWRYNMLGGAVFAVLLMGVKYIFRWYTGFSFDRFHLVYGSLTALVLIILWIFYLMNLFILCAELVAVLQKRFTELTSQSLSS